MLNDEQIEAIRRTSGKVAVIDWASHQLVFRRPSRDQVRDYRREQDSPAEKCNATDKIAQLTIASFDGETDTIRARNAFGVFLDEYPMFTSSPKFMSSFTVLAGLVEVEHAEEMGKGVSVRSAPPKTTLTGSPTGSEPSSPAPS